MREVMCVQPAFNDTNELILDENNNTILMTVDDALCANGSIGRPLSMIICNDHIDCPIRWRPGPWGVVSGLSSLIQGFYVFGGGGGGGGGIPLDCCLPPSPPLQTGGTLLGGGGEGESPSPPSDWQ